MLPGRFRSSFQQALKIQQSKQHPQPQPPLAAAELQVRRGHRHVVERRRRRRRVCAAQEADSLRRLARGARKFLWRRLPI